MTATSILRIIRWTALGLIVLIAWGIALREFGRRYASGIKFVPSRTMLQPEQWSVPVAR